MLDVDLDLVLVWLLVHSDHVKPSTTILWVVTIHFVFISMFNTNFCYVRRKTSL